MPQIDIDVLQKVVDLKELCNVVARLQKNLNYLLNGQIDFENVRAHSIVADSLSVNQLSAIAADLGTITAGIIYGAYIATANGTYPRIEFSSLDILLTAFSDALNKLSITPTVGGAPGVTWTAGGNNVAYLNATVLGPLLASFNNTDLTLQPGKDLNFTVNNGNITVNGAAGKSTTITYVKNVVAGTPTFGTMTFTKGILTSFT